MSCLRPVLSNPVLGFKNQNTYSKSHGPDMKIPSSDSESPPKAGSDDIYIIPFGGGHLTFSSAPWIILDITKDTEQISTFCVQIQNLLKKWV